ncbi:MAG: sigma factor-like helix-turn-helix DNA-binding protein [Patescibacteria group bacterium]
MATNKHNFDSKGAIKRLIGFLPTRAQDIIKKRYGLEQPEGLTLEAIGDSYGITRERVRQIEAATLALIRKSEAFAKLQSQLEQLRALLASYGGVAHESDFLSHLHDDPVERNQAQFFLIIGDQFIKLKEDDHFHHRWTVDTKHAGKIEEGLKKLAAGLSVEQLLAESDVVARLLGHLGLDIKSEGNQEQARRWLRLSKSIGLSPVGEWGLSSSPNVRVRGIRDLAFLVLRRHGSPLHFTEVAKAIEGNFQQSANPATCHNELIKDQRFVLVGRGLYALAEWGYSRGIVRDVIKSILSKHGPLTETEVLDHVLKERHVKPNTILVNLRNSEFFEKNKQGRFTSL